MRHRNGTFDQKMLCAEHMSIPVKVYVPMIRKQDMQVNWHPVERIASGRMDSNWLVRGKF